MAYSIDGPIGAQPIAETSTTQKHPLGFTVSGYDESYGYGEFVYLLGVTGTVVGSVATYNKTTWQTKLHVSTVASKPSPVAVAMSANVGSAYGWYQIRGMAVMKKTAVIVAAEVQLYISATAGRVKVIASAGLQIHGCMSANVASVIASTSTITANITYPHIEGQ